MFVSVSVSVLRVVSVSSVCVSSVYPACECVCLSIVRVYPVCVCLSSVSVYLLLCVSSVCLAVWYFLKEFPPTVAALALGPSAVQPTT